VAARPRGDDARERRPGVALSRSRGGSIGGAVKGLGAAAACLLAGGVLAGACGSTAVDTAEVLPANASLAVAAADPITISPLPGTEDASPGTQISFLGPSGTTVGHVRVVGSRSGTHAGVLRAYSTGTGESFLPSKPFAEGERVAVSARVLAGPMKGRVARSAFTVADQSPISQKQFPTAAGDPNDVQHYVSAPALTPTSVRLLTRAGPQATPGDLLMAPYQGQGTAGPMIVAQDGSLIWFHPLPAGMAATNLTLQSFGGEPVLEWWQGRILELGFGQGEDVIANSSYRQIATVRAGNGYRADLHVARITPEGTAWIDAYDPVRMNLSSVGGSARGVLNDSLVQEIDIKTGLVMWEWHALGHIPLTDSKNPAPDSSYPWDYVHVNSVEPGTSGDLLVSFRNTWSLDDIDLHSGGFRWRLGGDHSTFSLGPGVKFYWQHDAAFQPGGTISLFDNGSDPPKEKQSRGLLLAVDYTRHEVGLLKQFVNPARTLLASSQGSALSLPDGNWLLGYGGLPDFTEFDESGHVLLDGMLGPGVQNFRVSLANWSGHAPGQPSLVAVAGGVAVSWNGATEVASWRLLAGSSPTAVTEAVTVPKTGFQSVIPLPPGSRYAAVQALDGDGGVIGVSPTIGV